jgi:hypothetical protein
MAGRVSARTVVNRAALDAIRGAFVDGMAAMGTALVAGTHPPDDDPIGVGLVKEGDWAVWSDGKKVAGTGAKPKGVTTRHGVTLVVGYPFPARFNELGTIHQPARPFFTPTVLRIVPGVSEDYLRAPVRRALGGH